MADRTPLEALLNDPDEYISQERLMACLGLSARSFSQVKSRGRYKFKSYRIGRHVFYKRSEILAELEEDDEQG